MDKQNALTRPWNSTFESSLPTSRTTGLLFSRLRNLLTTMHLTLLLVLHPSSQTKATIQTSPIILNVTWHLFKLEISLQTLTKFMTSFDKKFAPLKLVTKSKQTNFANL